MLGVLNFVLTDLQDWKLCKKGVAHFSTDFFVVFTNAISIFNSKDLFSLFLQIIPTSATSVFIRLSKSYRLLELAYLLVLRS